MGQQDGIQLFATKRFFFFFLKSTKVNLEKLETIKEH